VRAASPFDSTRRLLSRELIFLLLFAAAACSSQVEASMNQVAQNQMRLYDLPAKLLCRVLNVELKVRPPPHLLPFRVFV
jgi:hypothetical protein